MTETPKTIRLMADGMRLANERRHTRNVSECSGCGQKILWCVTAKNQKPIPFDDLEVSGSLTDDGTIETVSSDGLHWLTCPKADEFRRKAPR